MRISICHYSFHREIGAKKMELPVYFATVKKLGLDACDLHMRLAGDVQANLKTIQQGLKANGLTLSSYSLSDDFTQPDEAARKAQVEAVKQGLRNAKLLGTDTARVFGGHASGADVASLANDLKVVTECLKECVKVAEEVKVTLALENHGGMPGRGEEVLDVIKKIGSQYLRACCDIGNFMGADQTPEEGTKLVAPMTSYVHIKDNADDPAGKPGLRSKRPLKGATVGAGVVPVEKCIRILKDAGYKGFLALEYEGEEDEQTGVKKSLDFLKKVVKKVG